MMEKIIAKYKDGSVLKGSSNDFAPDKKHFHFKPLDGKTVLIDMEDLKALFFVKTFQGNKDRKPRYKDARPWGGIKVKVVFIDGEELVGYTLHHSVDNQGFFVMPADLKNNNEKIFVITSATKEISFL
jgi:hypothetical protein